MPNGGLQGLSDDAGRGYRPLKYAVVGLRNKDDREGIEAVLSALDDVTFSERDMREHKEALIQRLREQLEIPVTSEEWERDDHHVVDVKLSDLPSEVEVLRFTARRGPWQSRH